MLKVERTNEAEIRPEGQSEKAESCRENLWNEIEVKGPWRQKQTREQNSTLTNLDKLVLTDTHAVSSLVQSLF